MLLNLYQKYLFIFNCFNRKVVKKYKEKIPRKYKPSDVYEILQSCEFDRQSVLKHDNIIEYQEYFLENSHICVVLEYCDVNFIIFQI
jgi:serine/threonine protein kinase